MSTSEAVRKSIAAHDWKDVAAQLDERGYARLPGLLSPGECAATKALWQQPERFRKTVHMGPLRFGEGEYRYFANPLPKHLRSLRSRLYPRLARIANDWQERLDAPLRFPAHHAGMRALCREHGQERPTPLLLRYEEGGYNCLHQDLYGEIAFPLQVVVQLSVPERDFRGGEFLLVEQRPRMQSRGDVVALAQGEALIFPNRERPVAGARGFYRVKVRHGVSRIHEGLRLSLGLIFHEAR